VNSPHYLMMTLGDKPLAGCIFEREILRSA
jgi:hypothetical protein